MFNNICEALHREMEMLDEKFANGSTQLNNQDLDHIDKMAHALKSIAGYEAMKGGESEYGYSRRMSRSSRYSRDGYEPYNHGVPDGYERSPRY